MLFVVITMSVFFLLKGENEEIIPLDKTVEKVEGDLESVKNQEKVYSWLASKDL